MKSKLVRRRRFALIAITILAASTGTVAAWIKIRHAMQAAAQMAAMHGFALCHRVFMETQVLRGEEEVGPLVAKDFDEQMLYSWRLPASGGISPFKFARHSSWLSPENLEHYKDSSSWFCYSGSRDAFIFAVTGPGTAFDLEHPKKFDDLDSEQILTVECAYSGIHWMAPWDADITHIPPSLGNKRYREISGQFGDFCVGFADGEVWCLSKRTPFDTLKPFFTTSGAQAHDRTKLLGRFLLVPPRASRL